MKLIRVVIIFIFAVVFVRCKNENKLESLKTDISLQLDKIDGDVALAFVDLTNKENSILILTLFV